MPVVFIGPRVSKASGWKMWEEGRDELLLLLLLLLCIVSFVRYEDTGDAAAGHATNAWQRPHVVFLRLLHIRHHWRSTLVRTSA